MSKKKKDPTRVAVAVQVTIPAEEAWERCRVLMEQLQLKPDLSPVTKSEAFSYALLTARRQLKEANEPQAK